MNANSFSVHVCKQCKLLNGTWLAVVICRQALVVPSACAHVALLHVFRSLVDDSWVCLLLPVIVVAGAVSSGFLVGWLIGRLTVIMQIVFACIALTRAAYRSHVQPRSTGSRAGDVATAAAAAGAAAACGA